MAEFSYEIKVPHERVAVLIGKSGKIKKEIEEATKSKLTIDSKEGEVQVEGTDPLMLYITRDIIKAIGRGFNPEVAMTLLKQDYLFELIDISEYSKGKANHLERLKGRIIGKEGKSRKYIEQMTETDICVYGKTAAIIGQGENVSIARRAIESLLQGSPHASVYKFLEKKRRDLKMQELGTPM